MLQLNGEKSESPRNMFKCRLDWKSYGLLFEEREGRGGKDLTEIAGMEKKFWHLSLGKIKLPTFPHYCLLLQQARKVAQMSAFSEQTLQNK